MLPRKHEVILIETRTRESAQEKVVAFEDRDGDEF